MKESIFNDFIKEKMPNAKDEELRQLNEDLEFHELMAKRMMSEYARMEDEIYVPDTSAADSLFVKHFATEQMGKAMPIIANDFLKHEAGNFDNYELIRYTDESWCNSCIVDGFNEKILSCVLSAARAGSTYSIKLLQYLYKTYYKAEYKTLKRFNKITVDEIISIIDVDKENDRFDKDACARIMTIAPFFDIELVDAQVMYMVLAQMEEMEEFIPIFGGDFLEPPEGLYQKCLGIIDELFPNYSTEQFISECKADHDIEKFVGTVLHYNGFSEVYHLFANTDRRQIREQYATTLMLLKMTDKKKEYSAEHIQKFASIFRLVQALCDVSSDTDEIMNYLLHGHEYYFGDFDYDFDPKLVMSTSVNMPKEQKKESAKSGIIKPIVKDDSVEKMAEEVSELREKLRKMDQEYRHLSSLYKENQKKLSEKQGLLASYETDRKELIKLREFVYSQTAEDTEPIEEISISDMQKAIKDKRIVVIGGHDNWRAKLKDKFTAWDFVSPGSVNTVSEGIIAKSDKVYFFTDILSHKTYYKYMNEVQNKGVDFGYIHSTNIEANIKQIYHDFY